MIVSAVFRISQVGAKWVFGLRAIIRAPQEQHSYLADS